jgi:hypothetical protein
LPPLQWINHHIPLINDKKQYYYYQPHCPDAYKKQLLQKINQYVKANWWIPITTDQAAPMLCIPKKEGTLYTVIDQQERNTNTIKDITPMLDQDNTHNSVAYAHYWMKVDIADAYKQIRIEPTDVWKTSFTMIYSTYASNTILMGDCNIPSTFQ